MHMATAADCLWYVQRGDVCLIKFQFGDGPRLIVVHTHRIASAVPDSMPIQMVNVHDLGPGLAIGPIISEQDTPFLINISLLDPYTCFNCGATDVEMSACSRCKAVCTYTRYCSRACQVAHRAVHRPFCGK